MQTRQFFILTIIAMGAFATGCASYHRDARAARATPVPANSVEGLWEGRWQEGDNPRHGGRLEWVLTRTGDCLYRGAAHGQWHGIFWSAYDANLVLTPVAPGEYLVQGDKDIWPFGIYALTGRVDTTNFKGTFTIAGRSGTMELQRPPAAESK